MTQTTKQQDEHLIEKFLWASQADIHGAKNDLAAGIVGMVDEGARDGERLDFLDECNRKLNDFYGTTYAWEFILNHNVTRLMCGRGRGGDIDVDLNDAEHLGLPSCRDAIDKKMAEIRALKSDNAARKTVTQEQGCEK